MFSRGLPISYQLVRSTPGYIELLIYVCTCPEGSSRVPDGRPRLSLGHLPESARHGESAGDGLSSLLPIPKTSLLRNKMATDPIQDVQDLTNSVQNLAIDPGQQVEDIINHIEFRSGVSDARPAMVPIQPASDIFVPEHEIDAFFESEAQEAIKMYLRGSGHPENPTIRAFVGDTRFASERPDPLLRSRLFLRSITGDEVIRRDGHSPRVPVVCSCSH